MPIPKKFSNPLSDSLNASYQDFLLECEIKRYTNSTIDFYKVRLTKFLTFCAELGLTSIDQVTAKHVKQYQLTLMDYAEHTQHGFGRAIRAFLNYCFVEELIPRKVKVSMVKLSKTKPVIFTDEEVHKLINTADSLRNKAIILTLLDSGVRCHECVSLLIRDYNQTTGELTIRMGKGKKDRTTFVGATTRKALGRYLRSRKHIGQDLPLFAGRGNRPLTNSGLIQILVDLREKTGIKHCRPHTFRRTMASNFLASGNGNIYHLADILGHNDITVLKKYIHISTEQLRESHKRFGLVDNLDK